MKKVIDGKVYNTETAELIEEWNNGYPCTDFKYCAEELYRTKKGAWFLFGEGGAMSSYSKPYGDMVGGGENIKVLSEVEAYKWLEMHNKTEAIEKHFDIEEA